MKNLEIANLFYKIADILEFQGIEFKPMAYRRAAQSIEALSEDIEEVHKQNKLESIPGVGKNIAKKIVEFLETGRLKHYEDLRKKVPINLDELLMVPELGPKKIRVLYEKLTIKNISDLKKAAEKHKIRNLFRFGEKTENSILSNIKNLEKISGRKSLDSAMKLADDIERKLRELRDIESVSIAGSLRRMKETIGDIDILVISKNSSLVMDYFTKLDLVKKVIAKGNTKSTVLLNSGIQVDLRSVDKKSYAAALNYLTGSKEHNIRLRRIAISKGLKLSEYGLFRKNKPLSIKDELSLYKALGLRYIEPELRENNGEIESSIKNKLPKLIKYNDVKGDLHVHTNYSDGNNTIEEMISAAKGLGYQYIAITDHAKLPIARGMNDKQILSYCKTIERLDKKDTGIKIFKGSEVDITKDGNLDLNKETLKSLDVVIGSVHSYFKMNKEEMTKRILKVMDNEYLKVLGHPTGRLIGKREPYDIDFIKIFEKARENKVLLEINSFPQRLDLKDTYIKLGKEFKVNFVINTDSHSTGHLKFIKYGIGQARRGWLESKNVVNCLGLKNFINKARIDY